MSEDELLLIDLSSIAHPIWHMSQSEPDVNATSQKIVARVRALAANHPKAAICCDCGKSFRHALSATYKANRPERDAALHHQIDLAREQLIADGFPVWAVPDFEADDVIATATAMALDGDLRVLVVSADKDLLQLVGGRVRAMSAINGTLYDTDAVVAKFGVKPDQIRDYLTLVGDASDNIKGAVGIGEKKAADLLKTFGTMEGIYENLNTHGTLFKPAMATALREFEPRMALTRDLVTLRTTALVPFDEALAPRVPKEVETFGMEDDMDPEDKDSTEQPPAPATTDAAIAVRDAEVMPAPAEWERGLDPRSMKDAQTLAKYMFESRMFSAYGTPQAVLSTIMVGRELGLPAMASLRSIHNIEGRHALSAALMVALVLKSGMAEYFRPVTISDKEATYETLRKGAGQKPFTLTHTLDMAIQAGVVKPKSGWEKNPTDMLVARAQARLARLIYPDLLASLYTPEELADMREAVAA